MIRTTPEQRATGRIWAEGMPKRAYEYGCPRGHVSWYATPNSDKGAYYCKSCSDWFNELVRRDPDPDPDPEPTAGQGARDVGNIIKIKRYGRVREWTCPEGHSGWEMRPYSKAGPIYCHACSAWYDRLIRRIPDNE